ncbi:MAG: tetratricopeptide repeat protein, partial [Firmicutes bacterium]|nr:tetratricopeptide repeat protein [Bacillota bacterium]
GQVYFSSGEFELAIADLTQVIRINPKSADAYINRAACFTMIKQYDKAIEDNKSAIGLDPNNDAAYYNMSAAYQLKGDFAKSLAAVDKAISLEPNNPTYLIGRGMVNFCAGNMDKSAEDYKKASQLDPKNRYSRLMYGLALMRQGKDGAGYFKEYLEKNNNTEWPKPVFRMLTESISPEECLKIALESDKEEIMERKCEAYFYIGEYYLLKNNKAKAKEFFEKCMATGVSYFNEYIFSKAELKKL